MVVTHTHAKDQVQRSVGLKDRVANADGRMDIWTEAIALPPVVTWSIITVYN